MTGRKERRNLGDPDRLFDTVETPELKDMLKQGEILREELAAWTQRVRQELDRRRGKKVK